MMERMRARDQKSANTQNMQGNANQALPPDVAEMMERMSLRAGETRPEQATLAPNPGGGQAGTAGQGWAGGVVLTAGGISDFVGMGVAGLAGLHTGVSKAIGSPLPSLTELAGLDPYGGDDDLSAMEASQKTIETISELWNSHVTSPLIDSMLPEDLEDDASEQHKTVMAVTQLGLDKVAETAHWLTGPQMRYLQSLGVDTTELEAFVDAESRAATVLALMLIGMRKPSGGKPSRLSAADMDRVLGDAASRTHQKVLMTTEEIARVHEKTRIAQEQARMPTYDQFLAAKEAHQGQGPAAQYGAPPRHPYQPELPLGEPQPLKQPTRHEAGQMDLFASDPARRGGPKPPPEPPPGGGGMMPEGVPSYADYMSLKSAQAGTYIPRGRSVEKLPPMADEMSGPGNIVPLTLAQFEAILAITDHQPRVTHGPVETLGYVDPAKAGQKGPATPKPPPTKMSKLEMVEAMNDSPSKRVVNLAKNFSVSQLIEGIVNKTRGKNKDRIGKMTRQEIYAALEAAGVKTKGNKHIERGVNNLLRADTMKQPTKAEPFKAPDELAARREAKRDKSLDPMAERVGKDLENVGERTLLEEQGVEVLPHKDHGNGLPAEYSHVPLNELEFLSMTELRDIAKEMNGQGIRVRGKAISGRTKSLLSQRIREAAASVGGKIRGKRPETSQAVKDAHEAHKAQVDELNLLIAKAELPGAAPLTGMEKAQLMASVATQLIKEQAADAAGLLKAGVPESLVNSVLGGLSRLRVAASVANQVNFSTAMGKLLENPKVQATLKNAPPEVQQAANTLMEKGQKAPLVGDRYLELAGGERGKQLDITSLDSNVVLSMPPSKGPSPHIAKFTVNELIALYRELTSLKPGIFVSGKGVMSKLERGFESLKQQAAAKWGPKAAGAQEGLISDRGQFYTPTEAVLLKELVDTAKADLPTLTVTEKVGLTDVGDALVKFEMDVRPDARMRSAQQRKYTLEDHGALTRPKGKNIRKLRPGQDPTEVGRGKIIGPRNQQGYFTMEAFNLLDPMRRKFASLTKASKKRKDKKYQRRAAEGTHVTKKGMGKVAFLREYLFGGKVIGSLQRKSVALAEQGKFAMMQLTAMLDQFPKHMYFEGMPNVISWYQLHTKALADLVVDSANGVSLAATLKPFQGKLLTNPRRYLRYLPGGLTMQRVSPKLIKETFLDLTTGREATTPMGQALRRYSEYLWEYADKNGLDTATYVRNWYPVIFRKFGRKDKADWIKLVESKARTPEHLARARGMAEHVMDVAFEDGGFIAVDRRPGLNGKHMNAEMRRKFMDQFTMEELRPFIVNDPGKAMYSYAKGLARRVANEARWGKNDVLWKRQRAEAIAEAEQAGMHLSEGDIRTMDAAREIIAHTYQTAPSWLINGMKWGLAWQNAMKLGLVTVGSLAEIVVGLINPTTQKHYVRAISRYGVMGMVQNTARAIWRDVPQHRGRQLAEGIARSGDVEMNDVLTATHAADLQSVGSNIVFQLNGLHSFTNMLQDINVGAFEFGLKEAVTNEFNVRLGRKKRTEMMMADQDFYKMYGIDMEAALQWHRDGNQISGGAFWDQVYAPALLKYLNDTVMLPRGVNMPRWMSNPWLAPFRHLLTYTSVFANTVLPDMFWNMKGGLKRDAPYSLVTRGRRAAKAWGGVVAVYGMSLLSEMLLDQIKYGGSENHPMRDKFDDEEAWHTYQFIRGINRSGAPGLAYSKLYDAFESFKYGRGADVLDGAVLSESAGAAQVLGTGLLAGEIDSRQAAKWLVRNGIPVYAAAVPRDDEAFLAEHMGTREDLTDDLADWFEDHAGNYFGSKSSKKFKLGGG